MPITKLIEAGYDFAALSGADLVSTYNQMATSAEGRDLGAKEVNRFSDTKTGVKRCEALASSIRARRAGMKAEESRDKKPEAPAAKPKNEAPAETAKKPKAAKPKNEPKKHETPFGNITKGSNRDKLLQKLLNNPRHYFSRNDLMVEVYGVADKEHRGPFSMVMKGLHVLIAERELPFRIETKKDGKETMFALFKEKAS